MIKAMPFFEYSAIWISLLGACRKWGNVKLGRLSFDQAIQLDSNDAAAYVLMADIFGSVGMLEYAIKIENMILGESNNMNMPWMSMSMSILWMTILIMYELIDMVGFINS